MTQCVHIYPILLSNSWIKSKILFAKGHEWFSSLLTFWKEKSDVENCNAPWGSSRGPNFNQVELKGINRSACYHSSTTHLFRNHSNLRHFTWDFLLTFQCVTNHHARIAEPFHQTSDRVLESIHSKPAGISLQISPFSTEMYSSSLPSSTVLTRCEKSQTISECFASKSWTLFFPFPSNFRQSPISSMQLLSKKNKKKKSFFPPRFLLNWTESF